ncbi:MAG: LptF/LptG family permease [Saprospiraceae bacterium]|nr:LptF/LptG family permease [Saprospiraceae bacterium]
MLKIKKLDLMLIKGFIPPFVLSFLMALFVLVMQVFWLYIDDILGKGAGILVILEFLFYLSFSLTPMALPIGVLLAGVFLFGNLGEQYELSSMKSAGISLFRIMRPLILMSFFVALFSWICSDYIIPRTNLKYLSRLHDLKRQKPTLGLDEAIFNEDFYGYTIRIGNKSSNGKDIQDILIYDHSRSESSGEKTIISATNGRMYVTPHQMYLIMELNDGTVYQDPGNSKSATSNLPFIRTSFVELTKVFDLSEFQLDRTDEDLFKNDKRMKNSQQLRLEIDSINRSLHKTPRGIFNNLSINRVQKKELDTFKKSITFSHYYSTTNLRLMDSLSCQWDMRDSFLYQSLQKKVLGTIEINQNQKLSDEKDKRQIKVQKAKFEYELFIKYSFAAVCLLFIFVGAPLGAIVRKGGYGYPLIICILVFAVYILLNTFCKRLTEGLKIPTVWAAWLPCILLSIPGIFLSWSAMRDRNVFDDFKLFLKNVLSHFKSRKKLK